MKVKLGDICSVQKKSNVKAGEGLSQGKYKFFTSSSSQYKFYNTYQFDKPALIFGTGGNAKIHFCDEPFATSTDCLVLYANDSQINLKIVYLYFISNMHLLENGFKGAGLKHISKQYLTNIEFDESIFINQNEKLERFNLIGHFIAKRIQQLKKLDLLVKSKFIEMFEDKGFPTLLWNDVFLTKTGKLDSNAMVDCGEYPFFTCAKEIFQIDKYAFDQEALLLAGNNAVGKYDVKYYSGKFNAYQRTYVLSLRNKDWLYRCFQYQLQDKLDYLQNQSKGTNTKYLTLKILAELNFIIPPISQQNNFAEFVKLIDKLKFTINCSLEKLETLKKALMQKCFG